VLAVRRKKGDRARHDGRRNRLNSQSTCVYTNDGPPLRDGKSRGQWSDATYIVAGWHGLGASCRCSGPRSVPSSKKSETVQGSSIMEPAVIHYARRERRVCRRTRAVLARRATLRGADARGGACSRTTTGFLHAGHHCHSTKTMTLGCLVHCPVRSARLVGLCWFCQPFRAIPTGAIHDSGGSLGERRVDAALHPIGARWFVIVAATLGAAV
jgi:hypothetical protein